MEDVEKKPGVWWFDCESDPRWNCSGVVDHLDNMHDLHKDARDALADIQERLGKDPPEDLMYTATRDLDGHDDLRLDQVERAALGLEVEM